MVDLDKHKLVNGQAANPGPFDAEIDYFSLGAESDESREVFNSRSEFRKFISNLLGIRVYRDGFEIPVGRDWLRLGDQQTSGRSFYGLRPKNTVGYIALSAKNNRNLEEKTDREGFKTTPYYENFYLLLQEFVKFSSDVQSFLRRSWLKFQDEQQGKIAKPKASSTPEKMSSHIDEGLAKAVAHEETLKKAKGTLERAVDDTQHMMKFVEATLPQNTIYTLSVEETTKSFKQTVEQANKDFSQIEEYLHTLTQLKEDCDILRHQIDILREQLNEAYETVSLGLTAEALSHEIHNVADQLAYRNSQMTEYLRSRNIGDTRLKAFTEYISTSVTALRKQLSHLAPSLRYVREKREKIVLFKYFKEVEDYYVDRFSKNQIELQIKMKESDNFVIFMNRGKLTQIIDNLILNSEDWLREEIRLGHMMYGVITIEVSKPFVRISDNGRGIDPLVEASLFEPFITAKRQGVGRGLGLFIVEQLLDSEGCNITLLPTRNKQNRLHIFAIDFTGGLSGNN